MSVVQKAYLVDTSNLQTELEHTIECFENCIIKKENEYAKPWNDWYKKCDECKFDKISYDKAYKDMQQKIEWLQAQLGDLKGKPPKVGEIHALSKPITSNSILIPQESKVVKNDKVIALGIFRINPFKTFGEEKHVPNNIRASARIKPITVSQPPVITKKDVNSDSNGLSSTGFPVIHQPIREKTYAELLEEERAANINTRPFQYFVIHQPLQEEISVEFLQEKRKQINYVQTFLRKFNRISFYEMPKVLSLALETIREIEHAFEDKRCQPEDILELFRRLHNDVQNIYEELAVYINTLSLDRPSICYNNDDEEDHTIAITPILSTEEPDNSLSMGDEHLDTSPATESDEVIKSSVENLVPIPSESEGIPDNMCDVPFHDNSLPLDILKDEFEDFSDSNDDSTSIDDDSFSIDDIEYVKASPPDSELVSLEVVEIVILEVRGIDVDIILTIKDDILREKLLNINLLIANIEALKDNPTPYSDFVTKSSSTSLNFLLEETNTFDNSLPESETFCFDSEEISSGSTTTRADISLPDYEAFYDDHVKEISSGSTTTHSNFSLYDSFIFDLSINPFPPANRSDFYHEEFADELAHIVSPPEYDCFSFKNEPNSEDFTMDVVEFPPTNRSDFTHEEFADELAHIISPPEIRENLSSTTRVNLPIKDDHSPLLAYVVWIFLAYLMYPGIPPYLYSFGNEDTIFDPGITINCFYLFKPVVQHSQKLEGSCQRILSSKSSFLRLQLGIQYPNLID
nr:hypothetical protein [Tanacetum cinerariifolium]